jgi:hypothetical protein
MRMVLGSLALLVLLGTADAPAAQAQRWALVTRTLVHVDGTYIDVIRDTTAGTCQAVYVAPGQGRTAPLGWVPCR